MEFVDVVGRRKWDLNEYKKKLEDKAKEKNKIVKDFQRPHEKKLDLTENLGKSFIVNSINHNSRAGYYCDVCDCLLKDSMTYLNHINGKKHQRKLGM